MMEDNRAILDGITNRVKDCDMTRDCALIDRAYLHGRVILLEELLIESRTAYYQLVKKTRVCEENG